MESQLQKRRRPALTTNLYPALPPTAQTTASPEAPDHAARPQSALSTSPHPRPSPYSIFYLQDLFYITILAALMGWTHPVPTLARSRPPPRVLSLQLLTSTVLQIAVVVVFQVRLQFSA
jgi:hypothetical protein